MNQRSYIFQSSFVNEYTRRNTRSIHLLIFQVVNTSAPYGIKQFIFIDNSKAEVNMSKVVNYSFTYRRL